MALATYTSSFRKNYLLCAKRARWRARCFFGEGPATLYTPRIICDPWTLAAMAKRTMRRGDVR